MYKISGRVKSENSKRIYDTDIYIDTDTSCAIGANCDCIDFIENSYGECDFFCKHLVATAIKFYQAYKEESREEELASRLKALTVYKEKLKLEVNIEENYYNNNYFSVDFKIGLDKLYVMKNIDQFIEKKLNCESIYYGKNFTYDPCSQEFNDIDEEIVDYIQGIMLLKNRYEYRYGDSFTSGKYLYLSKSLLVTFLKIFRDKKVYYKNKAHRIILGDIPIETSIRRKKDGYTLNIKDNISTVCNAKNVFMFNDNIYIPSKKQADILSIFLDYTLENKLEFNEDKKSLLFNNVLSSLNTICKNVNVDKKITNIINEDLKAKFYLDVKNDDMTLNPVMEYDTEKFGLFGNKSDNIVIRDTNKKDLIKEKISELKFILEKNHYIYNGNEYDLYSFLSKDYKELEKLGEVYYSDKLKNRKIYKKPVINANINDRRMGYLEFDFKIDDIDPKEYQKILAAFKENKKYYKLKDSSFINLEDNKLKAFLNLVDNLNITSENSKFHKNKAIVLNEYINENKLDFIKGKEIVQDINKKLKDIDKLYYTIPKELNATLRDYQIIGYKWLKNISYLGFGGILADEMGLGKTIQAITFILSEKDKKTLIVAPTSLIYNWQSELNKFASSLKVGVVHGSLTDRFKIIKNVKNYDVLLTTYGTLRNDWIVNTFLYNYYSVILEILYSTGVI